MPTYNLFGWQKPCYLLQEGYADSFKELIEETEWDNYGHESDNPKCRDCMVHSGFEATAVNYTFTGFRGMWATVKAMVFNKYANPAALRKLDEIKKGKKKNHSLTVLASHAA
jgi:hypothetical protein